MDPASAGVGVRLELHYAVSAQAGPVHIRRNAARPAPCRGFQDYSSFDVFQGFESTKYSALATS